MKTNRRATINKTSVTNFYDVVSSNLYDHYPLLMTGQHSCICHCPAGIAGRDCYHRQTALATLEYVSEDTTLDPLTMARIRRRGQAYWREVGRKSEDQMVLDEVRNLWSDGPEAA